MRSFTWFISDAVRSRVDFTSLYKRGRNSDLKGITQVDLSAVVALMSKTWTPFTLSRKKDPPSEPFRKRVMRNLQQIVQCFFKKIHNFFKYSLFKRTTVCTICYRWCGYYFSLKSILLNKKTLQINWTIIFKLHYVRTKKIEYHS